LSAGLCPDPLGSLQRSPDPLTGFKGAYLDKEEEGRGEEGGEGRGGAQACPLHIISDYTTDAAQTVS